MSNIPQTPREIIDQIANSNPQVVELATYLSLAARIEPALLRRTRLTFLPKSEPGLEADLWFSSLVQSRSPGAIMLHLDLLNILRNNLAEQQAQNNRLKQAWELLQALHLTAPEALRLEEEVTYLALLGHSDAESEIEALLERAVATMAQTSRIGDLTRWAARALPQLPELARQTSAAVVLALTASTRLGNYRILDVSFPDEQARSWLAELLPKNLARVRVGIRLFANVVEFCDPDLEGTQILEAPKTNPVLLEVIVNGNIPRTIQWIPKQSQVVDISDNSITIRTILGETYRLQIQPSSSNQALSEQESPANAEAVAASSISPISLELFEIWVTALLNLSLSNEQYREILLQGISEQLVTNIPFQSSPRANLRVIIQKVAQWSQNNGEILPLLNLLDNTLALIPEGGTKGTLEAFRIKLNPTASRLFPITELSIFTRYISAITRIASPDGTKATGFMITPDLLLTTDVLFPDDAKYGMYQILFAAPDEMASPLGKYTRLLDEREGLVYRSSKLPFAIVRVNKKEVITHRKQNFLSLTDKKPVLNPSSEVFIAYYDATDTCLVSIGQIVQLDAQTLHYLASTGPGSAGAPVFNQSGQLVAMHCFRTLQGDAGLTIQAIIDDIEAYAPQIIPMLEITDNPEQNARESEEGWKYSTVEPILSLEDALDNISNSQIHLILREKVSNNQFDIFLCYDPQDVSRILLIATQLLEQGILPWLDIWSIYPGEDKQKVRFWSMRTVKTAAVFLGQFGVGPQQQYEIDILLNEALQRAIPVIPVFLSDVPDSWVFPYSLQHLTGVDFRKHDPDPMETLLWGVTGQRDRNTLSSLLKQKKAMDDFDVFLSYNRYDAAQAKEIGIQLLERGILPWLDEWELTPGLPWQRLLENQFEKIRAAAVFVGKSGIAPWQQQEIDAFLRQFSLRNLPVIPVILPDAPARPEIPLFLQELSWVDFRKQDPDPLVRLIWGITAQRNIDNLPPLVRSQKYISDFDVFLCYNEIDEAFVKNIAEQLIDWGVHPWLDDWELRPGSSRRRSIEQQIQSIKSVAVFIGEAGISPSQQEIVDVFRPEFRKRGLPIIPVILPGMLRLPQIPTFLEGFSRVDFRQSEPNPLGRLLLGITGERKVAEMPAQLQRRREANDFDVFLCSSEVDRSLVRNISKRLLQRGILPWFDSWELPPGLPLDSTVDMQLRTTRTGVIFIGELGIDQWQQETIEALLREFVSRNMRIVVVLLSNVPYTLSIYLNYFPKIHFPSLKDDSVEQLVQFIQNP